MRVSRVVVRQRGMGFLPIAVASVPIETMFVHGSGCQVAPVLRAVDASLSDCKQRLQAANARLLARCELADQRLVRDLAARYSAQCKAALRQAEAAVHAAATGRMQALHSALVAVSAPASAPLGTGTEAGANLKVGRDTALEPPLDGLGSALDSVSPQRRQALLDAVADAVLLEVWVPEGGTPHTGLLAARRERVREAVAEEVAAAFEAGCPMVTNAAVHLVQGLFEAGSEVRATPLSKRCLELFMLLSRLTSFQKIDE